MQFENNEREKSRDDLSLNETWRELLGLSPEAEAATTDAGREIPAFNNDPWAELQHIHGIEIVDLQHVHMQPLDELDMEQVLQLIQELPDPGSQEK